MKLALAIAIAFTGSSHGFAVTEGQALYVTGDGGVHWRLAARRVWAPPVDGIYAEQVAHGVYTVVRNGRRIGSIADARGDVPQFDVVDASHIVAALGEGAAAGSSGQALYASADGGRTWRFVSRTDVAGTHPHALPFGCDKSGVGFATPARGFATAYCAGGRPFFYRTGDGGETWRRLMLPGLARCQCGTHPPVFFAGGTGAFAVEGWVGNKPFVRFYWTRDGGLHWRATQPAAGRLATPSVALPRAHTAWFVGGMPGDIKLAHRYVFRTTNDGRTWHRYPLPFAAASVQLSAVDGRTAFTLTMGPARLYRTVDGGRTWHLRHP